VGLLVILLCALSASVLQGQSQTPGVELSPGMQGIIADWNAELVKIDGKRVDGESRKGYDWASRILDPATERRISGGEVSRVLGVALVLKAIAARQLDRSEEALWLWHSAHVVWPPAGELSLTAYGEAGPFLLEHPAPSAEVHEQKVESGEVREIDPEVEPAVKRNVPAPEYPRPGMERDPGLATLQTVIEPSGRLSSPALVYLDGPVTFLAAALDALTEWRFEPATLEGEAVAVFFRVTLQFTPR